jgi:primary-amine oxidase
MALERTKQIIQQVANLTTSQPHHPLDPLTEGEIATAVELVRQERNDVIFNSVSLLEPKKRDLKGWLASPNTDLHRFADVIASGPSSKVYDVVVDLTEKRIFRWEEPTGVYPSITMEDLAIVEGIIRKDAQVIEQCGIVGIPPEDMHKVYCDPWTIGYVLRDGLKKYSWTD